MSDVKEPKVYKLYKPEFIGTINSYVISFSYTL